MTAQDTNSPSYTIEQFRELIDRELKDGSMTEEEAKYLETHGREWRCELILYKKRTEKQFTSSAARSFDLYCQWHSGDLSYADYLKALKKEKVWRVNAATFLQRIESRLQTWKTNHVS